MANLLKEYLKLFILNSLERENLVKAFKCNNYFVSYESLKVVRLTEQRKLNTVALCKHLGIECDFNNYGIQFRINNQNVTLIGG